MGRRHGRGSPHGSCGHVAVGARRGDVGVHCLPLSADFGAMASCRASFASWYRSPASCWIALLLTMAGTTNMAAAVLVDGTNTAAKNVIKKSAAIRADHLRNAGTRASMALASA